MVGEAVHRWQDAAGKSSSPILFEQGDGRQPTSSLAVKWPGAKGFHISTHQFAGGAHLQAVPTDHLVVVQPRRTGLISCRVGDERLDHRPAEWNVTLCPAGSPCEADSDGDVDVVMLSVPVETFAFAAAQCSQRSIQLDSRLRGHDEALVGLIRLAMRRASDAEPHSPLWWDHVTDRLVDHLLSCYSRASLGPQVGCLGPRQRLAVRDFVHDNIAEPLTIEMLAAEVQQTRSHFTRMFTRSTGLTPHQYVMRTRLQVAQHLMRSKRCTPAMAAAEAGFVDQSHLARWTRRMLGATVREIGTSAVPHIDLDRH